MLNNFLKNKLGGEKYLSFFWLAMLVLMGILISVGVLVFYSADIDVRETEANYLYLKISNCLIQNGFLISEALEDNFDIFEKCDLDKHIFTGEKFYFYIQFFGEGDLNLLGDISGGQNKIKKECGIVLNSNDEKIEAQNYPQCIEKKMNFLYSEKGEIKKGYIKILTASNNNGIKLPMVETR